MGVDWASVIAPILPFITFLLRTQGMGETKEWVKPGLPLCHMCILTTPGREEAARKSVGLRAPSWCSSVAHKT